MTKKELEENVRKGIRDLAAGKCLCHQCREVAVHQIIGQFKKYIDGLPRAMQRESWKGGRDEWE